MSNIEIKIATIDDVEDILEINQMTGELHEANLPNYFKHSTEQSQKTFLESTINSE